MIVIELIYNLALLVALSVVSGFIGQRSRLGWHNTILQGLIFGTAAVIGMLNPLVLGPGVIFDGRSVMISLCGLFFGPAAVTIAGAMAVVLRVMQGGAGVYMGVAVVVSSALLGAVFHLRIGRPRDQITTPQLMAFGLLVHVVMLAMTILLPSGMRLAVLRQMGLPVMLTYPLATVFVGRILCDHQSRARLLDVLRESAENLRYILKHDPNAIAVFDRDMRYIVVSDRYLQDYNVGARDIIGQHHYEVFPEMPQKWKDVHRRCLAGAIERNDDDYFERPDGSNTYNRWECRPWYRGDGQIGGIITYTEVTTERKLAERALRDSEEKYRTIFENAPLGLFRSTPEGRFIEVNPALAEMLGYDSPEAVLREVHSIAEQVYVRGEDRQAVVEKQLGAGGMTQHLNHYRRRDGTEFIANLYLKVHRDDAGRPIYLEGIIEDITARQRAEEEKAALREQYQQAQKMESVGLLAGGVAHDLNNLLSPILGYGQMLLNQLEAADARRDAAGQIIRAGERARDLVRRLLTFSRKQVLEFKPFGLNKAVVRFQELLRRTIREDIGIDFIADPSDPVILGDVGQLEQVIMNLAINAQDAMPEGGRLTIRTAIADAADHEPEIPGRHVVLSVIDTGHGIDAQTQARLFEPFFTTKPPGQGTGLGLATSYGIVKQHGGSIRVSSEPGHGSTFSICLPVIEAAASPAEPARPCRSESPRGTETILLVEDDEMVRAVVKLMAEHHGYTVVSASDGNQAMTILEAATTPVHLLLTDVIMPEMNGRELFAMVSAKYPKLKVLFMSGHTADIMDTGGSMDEAIQFIQKPFSTQGLAAKLRIVLDNG